LRDDHGRRVCLDARAGHVRSGPGLPRPLMPPHLPMSEEAAMISVITRLACFLRRAPGVRSARTGSRCRVAWHTAPALHPDRRCRSGHRSSGLPARARAHP
jgi:hypothetical protein